MKKILNKRNVVLTITIIAALYLFINVAFVIGLVPVNIPIITGDFISFLWLCLVAMAN